MTFRDLSPVQSYFCDALRYIAALAVALHHVLAHLDVEWYYHLSRERNANLGGLGVAIFFILSGFLITHTISRKAQRGSYDFRAYFIERFTRIYLVYIPALLFAAIVTLIAHDKFGADDDATFARLLLNASMLQGVRPLSQHGDTFALLGPSWTLSYEFWFYMLYGLAVLPMFARSGSGFFKGVAVFVIASIALSMEHFTVLAVYWLSGAAVGALFQMRFRPHGALALGLAVAALIAFAFAVRTDGLEYKMMTYITTATAAVLLFLGLNAFDRVPRFEMPEQQVRRSIAHRCAAFSYSLYITHIIFLFIAFHWARPVVTWIQDHAGNVVAGLLLLIFVNAGAWAFSLISEKHNDRIRKFLLNQSGRRLSPPALKWWRPV